VESRGMINLPDELRSRLSLPLRTNRMIARFVPKLA